MHDHDTVNHESVKQTQKKKQITTMFAKIEIFVLYLISVIVLKNILLFSKVAEIYLFIHSTTPTLNVMFESY